MDAVLPGEALEQSLCNEIDAADVFVAFVDDKYNCKDRTTCLELEYAVNVLRRRGGHLRIVVLLLEPKSRSILDDEMCKGSCSLKQLAWEECYDDKGVALPPKDNTPLHLRITKLRDKHLAELRQAIDYVPQGTISDLSAVVLLDRAIVADGESPEATSESAAASAAEELLEEAGATVFRSLPGWHSRLDLGFSFGDHDLTAPAFVQVLSATTAPLSIRDPRLLARRLSQVAPSEALRRSHLAYWLPEGELRSSHFEVPPEVGSDSTPSFVRETPRGFVEWITTKMGLSLPSPVVAYQDVDDMVRYREALRREVAAVVDTVLPSRPDDRELHAFDASMLKMILAALARRRPIIVAHNIGLNQTQNNQNLRRETINYFRNLSAASDEVLLEKGMTPEKVFWLAIIQQGNPIVTSASLTIPLNDFRLSRWFVLGLTLSRSGELRLEQGLRRDAVVHRLVAWAAESARLATMDS